MHQKMLDAKVHGIEGNIITANAFNCLIVIPAQAGTQVRRTVSAMFSGCRAIAVG